MPNILLLYDIGVDRRDTTNLTHIIIIEHISYFNFLLNFMQN